MIALGIAVSACIWALAAQWEQVRSAWSELTAGNVAGTVAAGAIASVLPMLAWRALLADAGSRLPLGSAARVYFLAQLGKYVPGSVWAVVAQVDLAREFDVPARRSAAVSLMHLALAILTGLVAAAVTLPLVFSGGGDFWWVFLLLPVLAVAVHPRVVGLLFDRVMRVLRRPAEPLRLSMRGLAVALWWSLLSWLFYGLHFWLLVRDLGPEGGTVRGLILSVGGFAFSWVVGFLVVLAPAGAGVREVALTLVFASVLSPGAAVMAALLSRLALTAVDLLLAGAAVVAAVQRRRHTSVRPAG